METKYWTLDAINKNGKFFRIGWSGTLEDAHIYACGLSAMYSRIKGNVCGVIVYDADDGRLVPRIAARTDCSARHEELWFNAIMKERGISVEEYVAWQTNEIEAQRAAI